STSRSTGPVHECLMPLSGTVETATDVRHERGLRVLCFEARPAQQQTIGLSARVFEILWPVAVSPGGSGALTMRPDGQSRQGRRNTTCIQQHMRTNLRTESGRYGCRSRVICCRISIPPCIRPKKQRTFGSQVPTAASGKNRNSLNIRRADRSYPCVFCGGSLCANSGHSLSTTVRISSEI